MNRFDLSPLFRASIGFDHLARLLDSASRLDEQALSYPPYNIERTAEDHWRITMALAGFAPDDLDITVTDRLLTVTGKAKREDDAGRFLHRGIAGRSFERRFELADHVRVDGAKMENGLLILDLIREVPEALKPRRIAIAAGLAKAPPVLESKQAA
jgi:molecular chaperone IbpA